MALSDMVQKPKDRALMATILGDAGMGKTRLAASFPKPIFVRAEDGMQSIPRDERPDAFPVLESVAQLWEQMTALIHEEHDYKTLVIDSVTALERMFGDDVLKRDGKAKALAHALGGFGAGYQAVGAAHARLRKAAGILNTQKRMNVIFIAHADVETMKSPDMDDYMRYTLRLNQKYSLAPYVDDVDLVGFVRLQSFVKGEDGDRKKAISTGARELVCHATASNISKNRYAIGDVLPFDEGENPLQGRASIAGLGKPTASEKTTNAQDEAQSDKETA